jgi:hypothetical protein
MNTETYDVAVGPGRPTGSRDPGRSLGRWWGVVTTVIVAAVFIEAVFAGAMLSGAGWARKAHAAGALVLIVATLAAGLAATAALRRVSQGLRLGLTLLALAAVVVVQTALGRSAAHGANLLWLHVPLGVALVGLAGQTVAAARRLGGA